MAPALAQFEQMYKSEVKVIEINVDQKDSSDYREYAKLKASGYIPETVVLKDGKPVAREVGGLTLPQLVTMMKLAEK